MREKRLIAFRSDPRTEYSKYTIPIFKKYAYKWNTDILILSHHPEVDLQDKLSFYRLVMLSEITGYDRILHLDSDMVITPTCPNPFEEFPDDGKVRVVFEDVGTRATDRRDRIIDTQKHFGNVGWTTGYGNTGFILLSSSTSNIFGPIEEDGQVKNCISNSNWAPEQTQFNYLIRKLGYSIENVGYKWNHTTMFSETWNNSPHRYQSYIIHYAGTGTFDSDIKTREEQIVKDIDRLYNE